MQSSLCVVYVVHTALSSEIKRVSCCVVHVCHTTLSSEIRQSCCGVYVGHTTLSSEIRQSCCGVYVGHSSLSSEIRQSCCGVYVLHTAMSSEITQPSCCVVYVVHTVLGSEIKQSSLVVLCVDYYSATPLGTAQHLNTVNMKSLTRTFPGASGAFRAVSKAGNDRVCDRRKPIIKRSFCVCVFVPCLCWRAVLCAVRRFFFFIFFFKATDLRAQPTEFIGLCG